MCLWAIFLRNGEMCFDLLPIYWLDFVCVCCRSCLYILEINPLLVVLFANILSHSEGYLFILFMFSFALQKLVSLIGSHLLIFAFVFNTLGDGSKKILLWFISKSVLPKFSYRSFTVSALTFRSLVHFEFILYMVLENGLFSFSYM